MKSRFWIKEGLKITLLTLGSSLFYTTLMTALDEDIAANEALFVLAVYLLIIVGIVSLLLDIFVYKSPLPLVISFGSTRKEAIFGLHLYRLIPTAVMIAIATALMAVSGESGGLAAWGLVPLGLGQQLLCHGAGIGIGLVSLKRGNAAAIISAIAFMILGGTLIGTGVYLIVADEIRLSPWYLAVAAGGGFIAYAVASIAENRAVKAFTVKL